MTEAIGWLLGLDRIRIDDAAPISLRFGTPPAPWIMLFGAIIAAAIVFTVHRRQALPLSVRWLLGILRFGAIMSVLFICGQPLLVLSRIRTEPSFVGVLLDSSRSMLIVDKVDESGSTGRWASVTKAMAEAPGLLDQIAARHEVGVWGFGSSARQFAFDGDRERRDEMGAIGTIEPEHDHTDIPCAIRQVIGETLGRRVAGLIVVSDGSQTEADDLETVFALTRSRSIPIHVIAVGSDKPRPDLAINSVWAPEEVFLRDTVSVRFDGTAEAVGKATDLTIELRDETSDELLVSQTHPLAEGERVFSGEVQFAPRSGGRRGLLIRVLPLADEEVIENNEARASINAHDEKIGVLYVEKTPRFEYRYLKNLLLREQNIDSSCMLLDASPGFPPEGTRPIRRFPDSIEGLAHYDVIILGDVDLRGNWITPTQLSMLADYVSIQGAGIAFLAGEYFMPGTLDRSPLEKLLPVELSRPSRTGASETITADFLPELTVEGRASPIFRLEREAHENEIAFEAMPGFYWHAKVARSQFGTTVLAVHPTAMTPEGPMPLAVLGRFGAGRTFYLGTDELWRWRQYSGDTYYESIWLQIIHTLARGRKLGLATPWRLSTDRRQYEPGDEVHVKLTSTEASVPARVTEQEVLVKDARENLAGRVMLRPSDGTDRAWEGTYVPKSEGSLVLSTNVPGQSTRGRALGRSITVTRSDPEMSRRAADHDYLRRIAAATGGTFRNVGDDLSELVEVIPDRSVQIADDIEEPIWDSRLMFGFLLSLLFVEWAVRRWRGLA